MEQQQTDEKFMRLALNEAEKALEEQEVPIGAVAVSYTHLTLPTTPYV